MSFPGALTTSWPFASPDNIVPANSHKAFRSITLLTSKVQQKSDTAPIKEDEPRNNRTILLLSVAFCILAALHNEVVAVIAKVVAGKLEVIVCPNHHYTSKDRSILQVINDYIRDCVVDLLGEKNIFVSILASRNARKQDQEKNKNVYPTIVASEPLGSLSRNSTVEQLKTYVQDLW